MSRTEVPSSADLWSPGPDLFRPHQDPFALPSAKRGYSIWILKAHSQKNHSFQVVVRKIGCVNWGACSPYWVTKCISASVATARLQSRESSKLSHIVVMGNPDSVCGPFLEVAVQYVAETVTGSKPSSQSDQWNEVFHQNYELNKVFYHVIGAYFITKIKHQGPRWCYKRGIDFDCKIGMKQQKPSIIPAGTHSIKFSSWTNYLFWYIVYISQPKVCAKYIVEATNGTSCSWVTILVAVMAIQTNHNKCRIRRNCPSPLQVEYSSCVDGLSLYFEVLSSPSSPELNCQCWRTGLSLSPINNKVDRLVMQDELRLPSQMVLFNFRSQSLVQYAGILLEKFNLL